MEELNVDNQKLEEISESLAVGIEQSFKAASERLSKMFLEMKEAYAEHKDEIDAEAERARLERERLQASMPEILVGDIVRTESRNACYEIDEIRANGVVSQPAGFQHRYNEIIAVYRFDGTDFKCIWEREDYKANKSTGREYE